MSKLEELPIPISPRLASGPRKTKQSNRYLYFVVLTFVFFVLWRNSSAYAHIQQKEAKEQVDSVLNTLDAIGSELKDTKMKAEAAQVKAAYYEGMLKGISKNKDLPDLDDRKSVQEALDDTKKKVDETVDATVDAIDELLLSGKNITEKDKAEAAEELIKTAIALEKAAEKLADEAEEMVGEKEAVKLVEKVSNSTSK